MLAVAYKKSQWTLVTGYTAPDGSIASWVTTSTTWGRDTEDLAAWSLSSGDINGDARADFTLIGHAAGSAVYVATSEKGTQPGRPPNRSSPQHSPSRSAISMATGPMTY